MKRKKIPNFKNIAKVVLATAIASSAIVFHEQLNESAYKVSTWREREVAVKIAKHDPLYKNYSPSSSAFVFAVGHGIMSVSGPSVDELNRTLNAYESGETSGIWKERKVLMRNHVIKKIKYVGWRSGRTYKLCID